MESLTDAGSVVQARVGPTSIYILNDPQLIGDVEVGRGDEFLKAAPVAGGEPQRAGLLPT